MAANACFAFSGLLVQFSSRRFVSKFCLCKHFRHTARQYLLLQSRIRVQSRHSCSVSCASRINSDCIHNVVVFMFMFENFPLECDFLHAVHAFVTILYNRSHSTHAVNVMISRITLVENISCRRLCLIVNVMKTSTFVNSCTIPCRIFSRDCTKTIKGYSAPIECRFELQITAANF